MTARAMENNIILHDFVSLLGNVSNTSISSTKGDFVGLCNQKYHVLWGGGGVGHLIFNLHLEVGHSVLCQMEGVVMCFLTTTF